VLRFSPVYNVIKTMFAEQEAGRLLSVTMRDDQDFHDPRRACERMAQRSFADCRRHANRAQRSRFDLLTWMFGPVASLYCRTRNLNGANGVEDFGATSMEFASGAHGQLTSIWHRMIARASNRRLEVFAETCLLPPTPIRSGRSFSSAARVLKRRRLLPTK